MDYESRNLVNLSEYWKRYKVNIQSEANKLEQTLKANTIDQEWQLMLDILERVTATTQQNYNKPRNQRMTITNTNNRRRGAGNSSKGANIGGRGRGRGNNNNR